MVVDDLIDFMRTHTDTFISTICADQIEHYYSLCMYADTSIDQTDGITSSQDRSAVASTTSTSTSTRISTMEPNPNLDPRHNLVLYLHRKIQTLPTVLDMARTCRGMDDQALSHTEYSISNWLARVRVLGASESDREYLDDLYEAKKMLWDKIAVWRMLEERKRPTLG